MDLLLVWDKEGSGGQRRLIPKFLEPRLGQWTDPANRSTAGALVTEPNNFRIHVDVDIDTEIDIEIDVGIEINTDIHIDVET